MPLPTGTIPITGPLIDTTGSVLPASTTLRDSGAVSLRGGRLQKVNSAGDGWEDVPGHAISAAAPTELFEGLLWYDTALKALKYYNGSDFVPVSGTTSSGAIADDSITEGKLAAAVKAKLQSDAEVTTIANARALARYTAAEKAKLAASPADASITPAKLDAAGATKQDAFLVRLNALRRDLNNIATLTIAEQRTLLLALGTLLDGPRPAPSAAYSGRTWIDDHNDRSYVCRNRQEVKVAVGGLWSDANTTSIGIEIAENLGDLDDPSSNSDYAYTYSDNKWWKGTTVGSADVWRETQPTTALSGRLTLTPNWNTVWLGQHRWDYNATQQLPHDALAANTDYYFFNTRTVTVRKFSLAGYSAAGTVSDHWQWESLIATAADIDIIEARDGNLPALANDGTDDRQIAIANDGIHFVQLIPEAATAATTGAWAFYSFANTNPYRRYIGVLAEDPASSTVGDFFYSTTRRRWRIYRSAGQWAWFNDHWEDLSDEDIAWPVRFIGNHATRAEATAYAASSGITTGQTFVAFTGSQMETGSKFVQGDSARFSRHWLFIPLNRPTHASKLFIDDVFSMPGGSNEDIETGDSGRNYKTVYRLDHTVRISKVKVAASSQHAQGPEAFRLTLLKGTAPNSPIEDTIHVSEVLWPVNAEQGLRDEFTAALLSPATPHTFDIPEVIVNRGEYLVVQLARVSTLSSRSRARVVRDLTEHHTFEAIRYVGSGTDDLDSGVAANYGIDNVEWTDAGLWIEIEYAIDYDVGAAISTNTDDYLNKLVFSVDAGVVKAKAERYEGGEVEVIGANLLASKKSVTDLAGKTKTSSEIATIADQRATVRYTNAEKALVADLGVQVVYHATRASYNAASATDGKLHILTV